MGVTGTLLQLHLFWQQRVLAIYAQNSGRSWAYERHASQENCKPAIAIAT
jgi:hypothetical protein